MRGVACNGAAQSRLGDFSGGDHVKRVILNSCGRPECPTCHGAWAMREGKRAAERISEARRLMPRLGPVKHVVVSPPRWMHSLGVQALRQHARRVLERMGWVGGVEVFHPWRTRAKGVGKYRRGQNYYSPHFHVVGFGWVKGSAPDGWLVKNLGQRDVASTLSYLLDHVGLQKGRHAVRWTGALGNNRMRVVQVVKTEEPVLCTCMRECDEFQAINGEVDWTRNMGPARAIMKRRIFALTARSAGRAGGPTCRRSARRPQSRLRLPLQSEGTEGAGAS